MTKRNAAIASLIVIAACILSYALLDIPAAQYFDANKTALTDFCARVTYLGKSEPYLILSALAFILFKFVIKRPALARAALFFFLAVAVSGIVNDKIKFLVGRSRPNLLLTQQIYTFKPFATRYEYLSFPSGHACTAVAACCALYFLRVRLWPLFAVSALAVLLSRVVIGSHFPSDVVFGGYLSVVTTYILKTMLERKGLWEWTGRQD
ncbi:MAG: phosphatase PAP2 family protein [Desulfobacteraceae bacterium]|nr:phosphatase PAP2 family protein [Desulfobacteraceae bacterium]